MRKYGIRLYQCCVSDSVLFIVLMYSLPYKKTTYKPNERSLSMRKDKRSQRVREQIEVE